MISSVKSRMKKKRFMVGRIGASVLILLMLLFLSFSSRPITTTYSYREMEDAREYFYMVQGNRIEQVIQFKKSYVERIGVCISNIKYGTQGVLKLKLHEKGIEDGIAEGEINLETVKTREIVWFDVKKEIDTKKQYQLDIITSDIVGELAILCRNQDTNINELIGYATEYGITLDNYLAVDFAYKSQLDVHTKICLWMLGITIIIYILGWEYIIEERNRLIKSICATVLILVVPFSYSYFVPDGDTFHARFYLGLIVYYILLLLITFLLYYKKKSNFIPFFVLITLLNGIAYSFVFMPVTSPDETTHFFESYRLSSIMMGQESTDEYGRVLVRNCDLYEKKTAIDYKYVIQLWEKCNEQISQEDEKIVASDYLGYISAPVLGYIPQAFGITLGRLFHVNYFWLIYFARFANLIAFTTLVSAGIYAIPKVKWLILLICSLPFLLQEVASCSYDTLIIAFSILLGCYVFKLMEQEECVSKKQLLTLLLICVCFAQFKPVYFPLISLVLMIPNGRIGASPIRSVMVKCGVMIIAVIVMLLIYHYALPLNMKSLQGECMPLPIVEGIETEQQLYDGWINSNTGGIIHFSSGATESAMSYLLANPFDLFQRISYTILDSIDWLVLYVFGNYMGGHEIRIPVSITLLFTICFCNYLRKETKGKYFKQNSMIGLYIVFLNCISIFGLMLVSYLQWSAVGKRVLIGLQGRYFYPLMITLIFGKCGKVQKEEDHFVELSVIALVHILTLLYSCQVIWSR